MSSKAQQKQPPQKQEQQPGRESEMRAAPEFLPRFRGADKLKNKIALITGGDSGIGRSVAVHMAREGADVAIVYLEENDDARETQRYVEAEGRKCLVVSGDVAKEEFCKEAYALTRSRARRQRHPRQRSCTRPDLDAADPCFL